ncbi:SLBB domain-containing protein [Chromobacterium violaceum]|uniref:SLBB domain-containing protein n=1 Tax=Chromobacterium violaceum TaxID=536 RepID=UPI0020CAA168|nr:SLBB domain-containing protein [Chromobacterium violaceum]
MKSKVHPGSFWVFILLFFTNFACASSSISIDSAIPISGHDANPLAEMSSVSMVPETGTLSSKNSSVLHKNSNAGLPISKKDERGHDYGETSSNFINFVKKSTGETLAVFGSQLFRDSPSGFDECRNVQVNPDYIIGSGDQFQLKGWGMVDIDLTLTVDRSGAVYLPRVGSIYVAGVRYHDLQSVLKKSIARVFNNFDLSVSLLQGRALQVYVVGHARQPGSYTLNSMSTLLNALLRAGGPSGSGSLRNIRLMRDGKPVAKVDLYAILVNGDKSVDQTLRDGDVIHIPAVGPRVALFGDVKIPAIYEVMPGETAKDMLNWAGGLESAAEGKELIVDKNIDNRFVAQAKTKNYNNHLADITLHAGDIFRFHVPGAHAVRVLKNEEFVHVGGEVNSTGSFKIQKGETLRQLIMRLGGITGSGYLFATQFKRDSVREIQQQRLDEVAERYARQIEQSAAARMSKISDKDNVVAVQSELDRQRQLVTQMRTVKAEGRIVLEMKDARAGVEELPDLLLQDGDQIEVPRKPGIVNVLGAVYQNSAFIYQPHRKLDQYLKLAGGVVENGDASSIYVIRADGTIDKNKGWAFGFDGRDHVNPGDTIVVPEKVSSGSWAQAIKEWTTILYQFGLGAAALKVLK